LAAIIPLILGAREARPLYAYFCLITMFGYIVAGLWTDTYLTWVGVFISALILVGFFVFPGIFWVWMATTTGSTLVLTGFYVRYAWRDGHE
ncbi:MAG TPA: hypothetical protein VHF69_01195, partial [Candidatus Synoicihabitans sp.]|nr:hypothetical protein [Candidatus Synoicihabitans sp.]